jgi:hypothetical protein
MKILDKVILPNSRSEKAVITLSMDEVKKRLYNFIYLRFNLLDNKRLFKKFNSKSKKYFGTIGHDFFIAQPNKL